VFHYPFEATPVFLLDLGKVATPGVSQDQGAARLPVAWRRGAAAQRGGVFSAICAHKLVYPTRELSFISFRKGPVLNPKTPSQGNDLIHCCADHSQYDPAAAPRCWAGRPNNPCARCCWSTTREPTR
jgi:arsenite oxidase small subunit